MPEFLEEYLNKIESEFSPVSIFLYGSRARGDGNSDSDYEIGVLFASKHYVGRSELRRLVPDSSVSLYPFRLEQLKTYTLDTPFNKNVYIRELALSGKTLRGERIVEALEPPPITVTDVFADAQFNLGYALAATIAHRDGSVENAAMFFYKSCIFTLRDFLILRTGTFPLTYGEIAAAALTLEDLKEYGDVIRHALSVREGDGYDESKLFKNISLLNQIIIPTLGAEVRKDSNKVLI